MKIAINNQGIEVEVPNNTAVKTINGINYLLNLEDKAQLISKEIEWEAGSSLRKLEACYRSRTANLANGGYGTYGEQFDIIFHDGIVAWESHIQNVKNNNPKPK